MTIAIRVFAGLILLACGLAGTGKLQLRLDGLRGQQGKPVAKESPVIEKGRIIVARVRAKERVIIAFLARDLGLFEAAAWFRDLNLSPPEHADQSWQKQPGRCQGEKLCRQVISWATTRLEETMPASQVQARAQEMEAELEAHIARHGKVILP